MRPRKGGPAPTCSPRGSGCPAPGPGSRPRSTTWRRGPRARTGRRLRRRWTRAPRRCARGRPRVARHAWWPRRQYGAVPPTLLVLAAVASVQFGAALAKTLFDELGAEGTVFVRTLAAALVLALIWRPRLAGHDRRDRGLAIAFGLVLAAMNLCFYASLDRIPLGIAVTFEFVGPLGVAVFGSRRPLDLLWVALAAAGILLLSDFGGGGGLDGLGVALALSAGGFWASYILLSARVGQAFPGGAGGG